MRKYAMAAAATATLTTLAGVLAAPALAADINGTAGPDVLVGTRNDDTITARAGNDIVRARAGDDLVRAGAGADRVRAAGGWDRVRGGAGPDDIVPANGADRVRAGFGNDTIAVNGDGRADLINCGPGRDVIWWHVGDRPDRSDEFVGCEVRERR